jgi:hypothetical protein
MWNSLKLAGLSIYDNFFSHYYTMVSVCWSSRISILEFLSLHTFYYFYNFYYLCFMWNIIFYHWKKIWIGKNVHIPSILLFSRSS